MIVLGLQRHRRGVSRVAWSLTSLQRLDYCLHNYRSLYRAV